MSWLTHLPASLKNWLGASLSRRLTAGLIVAMLASALVLVALALSLQQRALRHAQEASATRLARVFEASLQNAMLKRDLAGMADILSSLGQAPGVAQARLVEPRRGEVRFASQPAAVGDLAAQALQGLCVTEGCAAPAPLTRWQAAAGGPVLQLAYPIANQPRCAQCHGAASAHPVNGVLVVDFQPLREQPWAGATPSALLLAVGLGGLMVFAAIMGWTLQRQVTRPLARLTQVADRFAAGDLRARVYGPAAEPGRAAVSDAPGGADRPGAGPAAARAEATPGAAAPAAVTDAAPVAAPAPAPAANTTAAAVNTRMGSVANNLNNDNVLPPAGVAMPAATAAGAAKTDTANTFNAAIPPVMKAIANTANTASSPAIKATANTAATPTAFAPNPNPNPNPDPDEITLLGQRFDRMADRIDQSITRLKQQQQFLQTLVDAIPDPVLVIGPDFRIRLANAAYARLVGRERAALPGQCCHAVGRAHAEPCPATLVTCPVQEIRQRAAGQGSAQPLRSMMRMSRSDGTGVEVDIEAAPLHTADGEVLTIEVLRPLERTIRFSQEQRLSTIGLLANGVAHEIHNPLASIRLALQACLRGLGSGDMSQAELADYLRLVDTEIDRCVLTTQRLLQMSTLPSQTLQPVHTAAAVDDVLALLREECRAHRVHVHVQCEAAQVLGDDAELRQVLVNLLHNALNAMPEGGRISVTGASEAAADDAAGRYRLSVQDSGIGIAPDDVPLIFLPFFSRRADGRRGTGLGLAICKAIIERFGGDIGVETRQGQGSRFTVTLRLADEGVTPPAPPTAGFAPDAIPMPLHAPPPAAG